MAKKITDEEKEILDRVFQSLTLIHSIGTEELPKLNECVGGSVEWYNQLRHIKSRVEKEREAIK